MLDKIVAYPIMHLNRYMFNLIHGFLFWQQSDNSNGFVSFMKLVFTFKGDQEKIKIGYVQNPIMDRDKVNELPESQVHTS